MKKKLAIIVPSNKPEPFIQAHVNKLAEKYTVLLFTGGFLPDRLTVEGSSFKVGRKWFRALMKGYKVLFGKDKDFPRRMALHRELKKRRPDVVLAEYGTVGAYVAETCRKANIPLVVHFHGYDAYLKEHLIQYRTVYQRLFIVAHRIIAVSWDMKEQLQSLGAPEEKLLINVYGVDPERFPRVNVAGSPARAIFWGRMVEKKAPFLTLLAFEKALKEVPEAELVMIGDGPLLPLVRTMAQALGLEHQVRFKGAVLHHELPELIKGSRVFVQHSIVAENGDSEGSPNSILEAYSSGLPVVSTDHGGIRDMVYDGVTGFLVKEKDIETMGKKLEELFKDPQKARGMGEEGRDRVLQEHSSEKSIDLLKEVLEGAMR